MAILVRRTPARGRGGNITGLTDFEHDIGGNCLPSSDPPSSTSWSNLKTAKALGLDEDLE